MISTSPPSPTPASHGGEPTPPSPPSYPPWKSPKKMQSHCPDVKLPIQEQLKRECGWLLEDGQTIVCFSHDIPSKLQDGPQCGIVAMWMAASCLLGSGDNGVQPVEAIQKRAVQLNFSSRGEMFSGRNLCFLFNDLFGEAGCEAILGNSFLIDLTMSIQNLLKLFLDEKRLILVPYDADSDQRPGLRRGHKAHWAVLSGLAFKTRSCNFSSKMKQSFLLNERNIKILDASRISSESFASLLPEKEMPQLYFVARQSKSRRLFLFDANRLAHSNANLIELSRGQGLQSGFHYILPEGGVREGLAGKYVLVRRIETKP